VVQPPQIVRTLPPRISRNGLAALLALAAAIGLVVGFSISRRQAIRAIMNQADVQATIESPVVGSVFPSRKRPSTGDSPFSKLAGTLFLRFGELTLFGFVAFVGFCATVDGGFLGQFVRNPLASYSASVDRHLFQKGQHSGPSHSGPSHSGEKSGDAVKEPPPQDGQQAT
ncbi:hypothetical protein ACFL2H_13975, partial [Planctomycetota bacterium]